jgi:hypothetical protein
VTGGERFVQVWIPLGLTAWLATYLGHGVLAHDAFKGGALDWVLSAVFFVVLFFPVWIVWGFVCGLLGYRGTLVRGFEMGWEKAIDWTGRSHRYGRLSRKDIKRVAREMANELQEGHPWQLPDAAGEVPSSLRSEAMATPAKRAVDLELDVGETVEAEGRAIDLGMGGREAWATVTNRRLIWALEAEPRAAMSMELLNIVSHQSVETTHRLTERDPEYAASLRDASNPMGETDATLRFVDPRVSEALTRAVGTRVAGE